MPSSSESAQSNHNAEMDRVFHALSHRTRRGILEQLSHGPAMVSEIAKPVQLTRMAVSKHIRVLEEAKLIRREIIGRTHRCSLSPGPLSAVDAWLVPYREFWEGTLDALARYVEESE